MFSWTGLFLVGWLLYELASPTEAFLGVTIFCCKLGWDDFRTAVWLRSKDPVPARGKIELWIYIASGLWRIALAAFVIMAVLTFLAAGAGGPQKQATDLLAEAGLTALAGFTICALATMRALGLAVWYRRKLWLHPAIHETRKDNCWPPIPLSTARGGRWDLYGQNRAGTLIIFSITAFSFVAVLLTIAVLRTVLAEQAKMVFFTLFVFFGYPMLVLWMRDYQNAPCAGTMPRGMLGARQRR